MRTYTIELTTSEKKLVISALQVAVQYNQIHGFDHNVHELITLLEREGMTHLTLARTEIKDALDRLKKKGALFDANDVQDLIVLLEDALSDLDGVRG